MEQMALLFLLVVGLCTETVSAQIGDVLNAPVGKNATLNCNTTETITDIDDALVQWKHENSYALVFRDGRPVPGEQDEQFKGRVELADPDLRDGNLSIVLKNVKQGDKGIYHCYFRKSPQSRRKTRDVSPPVRIRTIDLRVVDKPVSGGQMGEGPVGDDEGSQNPSNPGLVVGLVGGAVGVIAVAVAFLYRFKKSKNYQKEKENSHNVKNKPEQDPLSDTTPPV